MAMKCKYCGFDTHEDVIKAAFWTDKGLIVVEDIPARLCEGCGEQFFEEEITRRIQKALTYSETKAARQIRVPLYSMSQVQTAPASSCRRQEQGQAFLCEYCKSETVKDMVNSAFWTDGGLVVVENIPARMCPWCKEQFYDDETAERISQFRKSSPDSSGPVKQVIVVPVFSFADGDY